MEDGAAWYVALKHFFEAECLCAELYVEVFELFFLSVFVFDGIRDGVVEFDEVGFSDEAKGIGIEREGAEWGGEVCGEYGALVYRGV